MTIKHAHIVTRVNSAAIKRETINGEDHYRIPSATLPDSVVMNNGLYPADEIEASYKSLEGKPAPLGHPRNGDQYVSALSPLGINKHWVGAWNENVRREGGRVLLDKIVNIRVANQTESGRQLIQAIEKQEPIHTSTGLALKAVAANGESNGKPYSWIATNMHFDHDAILIGEPGAATPEDGVGMFVNAAGDQAEVVTCNLDDDGWMLESMADSVIRTKYEAEKNGLMDKLRQAFLGVIGGAPDYSESSLSTNAQEGDMSLTKEEVQALLAPLGEQLTAINQEVTTIKDTQAKQGEVVDALKANADAAEAAKSAELDEQLKANGFDDEDLKGMTVNAKQKVLAKQQPVNGYHINASYQGGGDNGPQDTLPE